MSSIETLEQAVLRALPSAWTRLRRPRDPNGMWWLDLKLDDHLVTVQWSPVRGFGVSASMLGDGYGEGPEEVFDDEASATARVVALLRERGHTSAPVGVALRELRALLGHTQQELGDRMGVGQAAVSRLERRDDITIGSLQRYVEALGAALEIWVKTPAGEELPLALGPTTNRHS